MGHRLPAALTEGSRLPVVVAPMFLVSGPDLVIASCRNGVIGSFPTLNARTPEILDAWFTQIAQETKGHAPFAANIIMQKTNVRRDPDIDLIVKHKVPLVIASVGSPAGVAERVHGYGGQVFADVATLRHARKAIDAGVDGLILLTAGAGGHTGWLNPFAFVAEVREFYDGPIALAGCISNGRQLRAMELLGADLGYMGSAFLASQESMAPPEHKTAMIEATADDIVLTDAISGMPANFLRSRLEEFGFIDENGRVKPSETKDVSSWKNTWSAGHGVGHVQAVEPVATIVARLEAQYRAAQNEITPSTK